jgi:hypothetical protein
MNLCHISAIILWVSEPAAVDAAVVDERGANRGGQ